MPEAPARRPLPWSRSCYVCGEENPRGFHFRSYLVGDSIELPFTAAAEFAGWNDVIHGGFIATVLDEVMTWAANIGSQGACYSAEFTVRVLKPLRSGTECVAVGRMTAARRRIFDLEAELRDQGGEVYARATGRYMPVPAEHLAGLRKDLVSDDSCVDVRDLFNT